MTDLETKKKSGSSLICIGPAGRGNIGDRAHLSFLHFTFKHFSSSVQQDFSHILKTKKTILSFKCHFIHAFELQSDFKLLGLDSNI